MLEMVRPWYAKLSPAAAPAADFLLPELDRSPRGTVQGKSPRLQRSALWTIPPPGGNIGCRCRLRHLRFSHQLRRIRTGDFVFPSPRRAKPLSNMAMEMLLRRMKADAITVHGFRSSFRDWCGEETDHPRELAEAALPTRSAILSRGPTGVAMRCRSAEN